MNINYFMPARVIMGDNCVVDNHPLLKSLGKKALILSGKNSARANGSLADMTKALEANGQSYCLFDRVMSNPTTACVYEAARTAVKEGCDFVAALGGGSPMDAAKAAAALALNPVEESSLFTTVFTEALPVVAVPTTAGTGSEATPYAILTNDAAHTKTSLASPVLFPRYAFLDARYTLSLSRETTINTAIDALTHAVEGALSIKASPLTDALARESIAVIAGCFGALGGSGDIGHETRRRLLYGSLLGGMVIANTGTTAVHALGYALTYHRHIDHGRANGLVFAEYLRAVEQRAGDSRRIPALVSALGVDSLDVFAAALDGLLGEKERFEDRELRDYAEQASGAKNIANGIVPFDREALLEILTKSLLPKKSRGRS
ncbi:MAG: iron-containing alcohol dehydrogenase [Spirochaetaceae bacterium]|nr:iron-containing alcohol dehydrogenase [Spirochaetaceae bacterium]